MLTGASQAEGAILVVDGLDGVQEQTRRHAELLAFLGLRRNIVVVNKMDLIGYSEDTFGAVQRDIAAFFETRGIPMTQAIPIVAANGDNIASPSPQLSWYTGPTLLEALDALPKGAALAEGPFRLPVQDVYDTRGERIVVGRIESGRVAAGDRVMVLPGEGKATVTSVREFGRERQDAECGESIGLTIDGAEDIRRGQMLTAGGSAPITTREIHCTVCWLSGEPLQLDEPLIFRCNTQETPCRISRIARRMDSSSLAVCEENARHLEETEIGEVCIATEQPVLIESFAEIPALGRFVLERGSAIVAGGVYTC
jgi:bifunctional enzyme CysN/CysC